MVRSVVILLFCALVAPLSYSLTEDVDPDFEAETELEMRNLQNQIHNNEDEIEALKLKDVALEQHHHDSMHERIRYLESEAQKFETAISLMKWMIGAFGVIMVPLIIMVIGPTIMKRQSDA